MSILFHFTFTQDVPNNCENPAHTKPLFWKYFLDVQGVGTYLSMNFFDSGGKSRKKPIIYVLSEVMKRTTVNSYGLIITVFQNAKIFHVLLCSEYHQRQC